MRQWSWFGWSTILVVWMALTPSIGLAADCVWFGGTGAWDEPGNWSDCDGAVPGETDTVTVDAGIVSLSGHLTIRDLTFEGGRIQSTGAGQNSLTVTENLLLTGGDMVFAGVSIRNQGSAVWTSGLWQLRPETTTPPAFFYNEIGASFTADSTGGDLRFSSSSSSSDSRFFNEGSLYKIGLGRANFAGFQNSGNIFGGPRLINNGSIEVEEGIMMMRGGSSTDPHEGSFNVAAGGFLILVGNSEVFAEVSSISGEGEVRFFQNGPWTLNAGMTYDVTGLTRVSDATSCPCRLRIDTDAFTGSLHMQSGSGKFIEGVDGSLTVADSFDWHTGAIGQQFAGNFTLNVLGGITLHSGISAIAQRGIINHHGTAIYESGTFYLRHPTARFVNHPGATFEIQGERLLSYRLGGSDPVHGVFDNRGSLLKTGAEEATIEGIAIENSGVIDVQEGSLRFTRHSSQSQPWQGARLILNDGVVHSQTPLVFENSRLYGHGVINADVDIDNGIFLGSGTGGSYEAGVIRINGNLSLADTSQFYARLVSDDPQPGVGFGQLQIQGDSPTELRGALAIHIDSAFVGDIQVGDEFVVMTCSQGCTRFFDQVAVTVPNPSPIFFEALYQGNQVVLRATDVEPLPVDPPTDLVAESDGPVFAGQAVNLSAFATGEQLYYFWTFGDGNSALGSHVEHVYSSPGFYTATVNVANPGGSETTTTMVEVLERPNFAGRTWLDLDGDGQRAPDEPWLAGVAVSADGPGGNLSGFSDGDGHWRIETLVAGQYQLSATLAGHRVTTPQPQTLPLPADGSALLNFGLSEAPAPGTGWIVGRTFTDFGHGFQDGSSQSLAGVLVEVYSNGALVASQSSNAEGLFRFENLVPGTYTVRANAPAGHFPAVAELEELVVTDQGVVSAMVGFQLGGALSGRVCSANGQAEGGGNHCGPGPFGLANIALQVEDLGGTVIETTTTASGGTYQFPTLPPGDYRLRLDLPDNRFTDDGESVRLIQLSSGAHVEDWVLHRLGRLTIRSRSGSGIQAVPIGGIEFEVEHPDGSLSDHATGPDGEVRLDDLDAGTYIVRPQLASVPPESTPSPSQRTATVANNTAATAQFAINPAQSIRTLCRKGLQIDSGTIFECTVEVRLIEDGSGQPGDLVYSIETRGQHLIFGLAPGSYQVRLIPDNAAWPEHEESVFLNEGAHPLVNYPYNPTSGTTDIQGFVYHDVQNNGIRNCNQGDCTDSASNGITVRLFNEDGVEIASRVTESISVNNQWHPVQSGHYRFEELAPGNDEVRVDLPIGFAPRGPQQVPVLVTAIVSLQPVHFGYRRFGETSISARVFHDQNGDGVFQSSSDDPVGGVRIRLEDHLGATVEDRVTSPNGQVNFSGQPPGEYRLVLLDVPAGYAGQTERVAMVPAANSSSFIGFPLSISDGLPRVLVFVDANADGIPGTFEQRVAGATVDLYDAPCAAANTVAQTLTTNGDGIATGSTALNQSVGCARVRNLPPGMEPVHPGGVSVLKHGGPAWLPARLQGQVRVEPFADYNGNGQRNAGEPIIEGIRVVMALSGEQRITTADGASFFVPPNTSQLVLLENVPSGWQVMRDIPIEVSVGAGATTVLRVPLVHNSGISGLVRMAGSQVPVEHQGVELENLDSGEILQTQTHGPCSGANCPTLGAFSFSGLPPANYRVRLHPVPPGFIPGQSHTINLTGGGQTSSLNLWLFPAETIDGVVYVDNNFNGQRNNGEPGTSTYSLTLHNDAGLPTRTIQPGNQGQFAVQELQSGVNYRLTVDPNEDGFQNRLAVTELPGWFSLSTQPQALAIGVQTRPLLEETTSNIYYGQVYTGPSHNRQPVAGVRVEAYLFDAAAGAAGCDQASPTIRGEGFTDTNGHFVVPVSTISYPNHYCLRVTDAPGLTMANLALVEAYGGYPTANGFFVRHTIRQKDIAMVAGTGGRSSASAIVFSAFRDDNLNASREGDEALIGGLEIDVAGQQASTGASGSGRLDGLPDGLHSLTITPPPGYVVVGPTTRSILLSGVEVLVPPIALRPAGAFSGQVFADFDGDGRQSADEAGLGGVQVQLTGPSNVSLTTDPSGRFQTNGLPPGQYSVSVTAPSGFHPVAPMNVSVGHDGGWISVPLVHSGLLTGVVYEDHDGDGRRGADEPMPRDDMEVLIDETPAADVTVGRFSMDGLTSGPAAISAQWTGIETVETDLGANGDGAVALGQVPEGVVRGTLWLDLDGDGIRQPWDPPMSGVEVVLDGIGSRITDAHGRFVFLAVAPGEYAVQAVLPPGLGGSAQTAVVEEHRGAAVGLAIQAVDRIFRDRFSHE